MNALPLLLLYSQAYFPVGKGTTIHFDQYAIIKDRFAASETKDVSRKDIGYGKIWAQQDQLRSRSFAQIFFVKLPDRKKFEVLRLGTKGLASWSLIGCPVIGTSPREVFHVRTTHSVLGEVTAVPLLTTVKTSDQPEGVILIK